MNSESRCKGESLCFSDCSEDLEIGPGTFGIDVIGSHWRNAAPVVDTRIEEHAEVVGEVRRGLEMYIGRKDQPGQCDCVEVHIARTRVGCMHRGSCLGKEILNDDFLYMAVTSMRVSNRFKGSNAIVTIFADSDENSGCERNGKFTCSFECCQSTFGSFVWGTAMTFKIASQ